MPGMRGAIILFLSGHSGTVTVNTVLGMRVLPRLTPAQRQAVAHFPPGSADQDQQNLADLQTITAAASRHISEDRGRQWFPPFPLGLVGAALPESDPAAAAVAMSSARLKGIGEDELGIFLGSLLDGSSGQSVGGSSGPGSGAESTSAAPATGPRRRSSPVTVSDAASDSGASDVPTERLPQSNVSSDDDAASVSSAKRSQASPASPTLDPQPLLTRKSGASPGPETRIPGQLALGEANPSRCVGGDEDYLTWLHQFAANDEDMSLDATAQLQTPLVEGMEVDELTPDGREEPESDLSSIASEAGDVGASLESGASRHEWTPEEDNFISHEVARIGPQWRLIAKRMLGRSDSSIRNRWARLMKLKGSADQSDMKSIKKETKIGKISAVNVRNQEFAPHMGASVVPRVESTHRNQWTRAEDQLLRRLVKQGYVGRDTDGGDTYLESGRREKKGHAAWFSDFILKQFPKRSGSADPAELAKLSPEEKYRIGGRIRNRYNRLKEQDRRAELRKQHFQVEPRPVAKAQHVTNARAPVVNVRAPVATAPTVVKVAPVASDFVLGTEAFSETADPEAIIP